MAFIESMRNLMFCRIVGGILLNNSGILRGIVLPKLDSMKDRYDWWREHKKALSDLQMNLRTQRLERMERLNSLKITKPEFLERLEFSYLSYEKYEYHDGDVVYCDVPYLETRCTRN